MTASLVSAVEDPVCSARLIGKRHQLLLKGDDRGSFGAQSYIR